MTGIIDTTADRRKFLGRAGLAGLFASGALSLPGCAGPLGGYGLEDAMRRLLFLSSERAFARLVSNAGYWDTAVAQLGLNSFLGSRGDVLSRILTSPLFKNRLESAFAEFAYEGADRAAPIVADAVRVIGISNAIDLVRGGPSAATSFLRNEIGDQLITAMVPEIGGAMRIAQEPLIGQLLAGLTGVDVNTLATSFSARVSDVIWQEMALEEAQIRADPRATNDPAIISVFGPNAVY